MPPVNTNRTSTRMASWIPFRRGVLWIIRWRWLKHPVMRSELPSTKLVRCCHQRQGLPCILNSVGPLQSTPAATLCTLALVGGALVQTRRQPSNQEFLQHAFKRHLRQPDHRILEKQTCAVAVALRIVKIGDAGSGEGSTHI